MTLDNILEEIKKANNIVLLTHENPDGDAIGSSLGMYNALKNMNKEVDLIIPEPPKTFDFLKGFDEIKQEGMEENYDLAIALDCADIKRLNGASKYFEDAKKTISIDHHGSNSMYADINYVDPVAPACCQILIVILDFLQIDIDKEIGECLLAGIITDTGGFKYQGTTKETFEFAAWLLSKGVNVSKIYKKVMETRTKANFELTKIVTDRMEFLEDGKIAFTYITKQDIEDVNAQAGDTEGLVEIGRTVEGVEVAVLLRESDKGYKISLRSNEYVNVSDVAMIFGGGGHPRAAGGLINLPLEQVKQKIINEIKINL